MSQISLKSISGITSITTPAGVDNRFSLYNFDSTERFVLDHSGNLNISGVSTATNFKTGFSNVHSLGFDVVSSAGAGCTIRESGNAVFSGIVTAAQFKGDGSNLTGVVQSDTPVGSNNASTTFYEMDKAVTVSTDTTLSRASSNPGIIYTKFQEVEVAATKSLIVDTGEVLLVNTYNLSS
tara:strand:+ start:168 stop:707 length:540 start_codon:yes stop_codon:yes gene_type:complete